MRCWNVIRPGQKLQTHHLFKSGELLGLQLVTSHNIFFMNSLMELIRDSIENQNLEQAEKEWFS